MRKTILFLAVLALACIAYMAWPAYDLTQFVRAVERGDTTTAAHYVNLARVRVSLTEQICSAQAPVPARWFKVRWARSPIRSCTSSFRRKR
jgi:signal transduction protein with GAF and PtsI domain